MHMNKTKYGPPLIYDLNQKNGCVTSCSENLCRKKFNLQLLSITLLKNKRKILL